MRTVSHPKTAQNQRVLHLLQERIARGTYAPGVWLPTERELAEEFAVNRSVIRGAFATLEEQDLIVREPGRRPWVRQHGEPTPYMPEPGAIQRASRTLAVIIPQHPVYHASTLILHGINLELRSDEAPFHLLVYDTFGETAAVNVELEQKALHAIEQEDVAGIIIWQMGGSETTPQLRRLQTLGIPLVCVDRYPADMTCDFVGVDNEVSAVTAVNYLLSLGHRRIAHLTNTEQTTGVLERKSGYIEALRSAGIVPCREWTYLLPEGGPLDAAPAVDQFFGADQAPTALFAMNDALAHYFIVEAESRGFHVPEAISVIGFDDLERYSPRPALLTTMHQPFDQVGRRAARLLLQRLTLPQAGSEASKHILLQTSLVVRSTTLGVKERRNA